MSNQPILGVGTDKALWSRATPVSNWVSVPASGAVIGITVLRDGTLVGVGTDKNLWTRATLTSPWVNVPNSGVVSAVAVLKDGSLLGIGTGLDLWTRATLNSNWVNVPNSGAVIAVTVMPDGTLVGVGTDKNLWTRATLTSPWVNIPNSGVVLGIAALADGSLIGIGTGNDLWTRATLTSSWVNIPNSGAVVAVAALREVSAPATLTILSGNNQTAARIPKSSGIATANFAPLSVVLKDGAGKPLAGQQVAWSSPTHPGAMAVQMEPSGAAPCMTVTDSNGVATLNKMGGSSVTAYYADGGFTINATASGASTVFSGTVGGVAALGVTASLLSGNNQSVVRTGSAVPGGMASFAPLQVKLVNASGQPAAGVKVGFAVGAHPNAMAVQMEPAGSQATSVVSDASGVATLNHMGGNSLTCYYAQGSIAVIASPEGGNPVSFALTVAETPQPPAPLPGTMLTILSGNNQTAARIQTSSGIATASFAAMSVLLKDAAGKPLAGQPVTWSSPAHPSAMAVQMEPSGASPCVVITDANGVATLNKMGGRSVTAYYADGTFTIAATYGSASAVLSGTVGGAPAAGLTASILSGNNQSVPRSGSAVPGGMANFAPLQVKLLNASGQPAPGIRVGFAPGAHSNSMAIQMEPGGGQATSVVSDSNGIATLNHMGGNSLTCYYASGAFGIIASPDAGNQVTFGLTVSS